MTIFQRVQEMCSEQERDGWPSIVTLTLSLHRWVIDSTHHLTKANIWPKFNKAVWMATEQPQKSGSKWWPSIVTLTLSQHSWVMGSAHHLTDANIWPTFKENPSRGKGDMEPTPNSRLKFVTFKPSTATLTLSLQCWVMGYAHCPTEVNIWPKFRENPPRGKGDTGRTQNSRLKPMTLNCDLVSLHDWAMGPAHHFTGANIWPKLKENPSRGKGDIEWSRRYRADTKFMA